MSSRGNEEQFIAVAAEDDDDDPYFRPGHDDLAEGQLGEAGGEKGILVEMFVE
jgi:hypothetical protein